jgi:hypothetical protein
MRVLRTPVKNRPSKRASLVWRARSQTAAGGIDIKPSYAPVESPLAGFGHGHLRRSADIGRGTQQLGMRAVCLVDGLGAAVRCGTNFLQLLLGERSRPDVVGVLRVKVLSDRDDLPVSELQKHVVLLPVLTPSLQISC